MEQLQITGQADFTELTLDDIIRKDMKMFRHHIERVQFSVLFLVSERKRLKRYVVSTFLSVENPPAVMYSKITLRA